MKYLGPTQYPRLNEAVAIRVSIRGTVSVFQSGFVSSSRPFLEHGHAAAKPVNLTGRVGAFLADFLSAGLRAGRVRRSGADPAAGLDVDPLVADRSALGQGSGRRNVPGRHLRRFRIRSNWQPIAGSIPAGGLLGSVLADYLVSSMNLTGAALFTAGCWIVSIYLVSTFEMSRLAGWFRVPLELAELHRRSFRAWRECACGARRKREPRGACAQEGLREAKPKAVEAELPRTRRAMEQTRSASHRRSAGTRAWEEAPSPSPFAARRYSDPHAGADAGIAADDRDSARRAHARVARNRTSRPENSAPSSRCRPPTFLQEPAARSAFDSQELKEIAARIKSKFEEFNVLGSVTQINPGPVVTTFEFKPEAGVKYSRITTLTRGSVPRPASRIDSDRAHSRQTDRRHRSAELASAK